MVTRKEDFASVFEWLKAVLEEHEPALVVTDDGPESYSLYAPRAGGTRSRPSSAPCTSRRGT